MVAKKGLDKGDKNKPGAPGAKKGEPPGKGGKPGAGAGAGAKGAKVVEQGSRRAAIKHTEVKIDRESGKGRKLTEAEIKKAAAEGKKIVGYSPTEIDAFLRGHKTLGELEGIGKEEQYKMAEIGYRLLSEGKL